MALIIGSYPDGARRTSSMGHRDVVSLDLEPWLLLRLRDVGANPDAVLKQLGGGFVKDSTEKFFMHGVRI